MHPAAPSLKVRRGSQALAGARCVA